VKILLFTALLFLFSCSSPGGRALVYDVKSNKGALNKGSGTYIASGKSIKKGQKKYVVEKGDTLYSIAWRADMAVSTLIKRNNLKKPYIIKEGQVLKLHASTSKVVVYSSNKEKNSAGSCTVQTCKQNSKIEVVKKSTKAYSANEVDKKVTKKKSVNQQGSNNKVADWQWPSKGKLTKSFANSPQGMKGISISNVRGTPIYAAAKGKVVYAGSGLRGYGKLIIIKHNHDYLSAYAHNDKLIIKENEQVKMGQKIALMGDSDTGSVRLHFDIRYRGKSVDPMRYLPKR